MISWGDNIVVTEPAPALASPARYLAPKIIDEELDEITFLLGAFAILLINFAGGGIAGELAAFFLGEGVRAPVWVAFDLTVAVCVAASYRLVARHGLRFPDSQRSQRTMAAVGNVAFTCLSEDLRAEAVEHLRVMNAAGRLLLVAPGDQEARAVLKEESGHLQDQAFAFGDVLAQHTHKVADLIKADKRG
ncbi:hypothetical protein [Streptomyces sp. NRRL F-5193]|uniref:hypothetical protein n=1 Tax=Streptomyces sp. NRRL F-5193 TaxID=1463860 RepID=UPI0005BCEB59|nr:hypothetical protein [Streptomyces sp. NRRL F-5193]